MVTKFPHAQWQLTVMGENFCRVGSNKIPDQEGIKTGGVRNSRRDTSSNKIPDQEGIKTPGNIFVVGVGSSNKIPDQEGIKTGGSEIVKSIKKFQQNP